MKAIKKELDLKPRIIRVSKLGKDGKPLLIYVHPCTTKEYSKIMAVENETEKRILSIIHRARDEKGDKLFSMVEKDVIEDSFGPKIITKIAQAINIDLETLDDETGIEILEK